MKTVITLMFLFSVLTNAIGADINEFPIDSSISEYYTGKYYSCAYFNRIKKTKKWTGLTRVPLSPADAERLALDAIKHAFPSKQPVRNVAVEWDVSGLELRRLSMTDNWYYRVECRALTAGSGSHYKIVTFVYLDGEVAEVLKYHELNRPSQPRLNELVPPFK